MRNNVTCFCTSDAFINKLDKENSFNKLIHGDLIWQVLKTIDDLIFI